MKRHYFVKGTDHFSQPGFLFTWIDYRLPYVVGYLSLKLFILNYTVYENIFTTF
jgi:hypothetical protein